MVKLGGNGSAIQRGYSVTRCDTVLSREYSAFCVSRSCVHTSSKVAHILFVIDLLCFWAGKLPGSCGFKIKYFAGYRRNMGHRDEKCLYYVQLLCKYLRNTRRRSYDMHLFKNVGITGVRWAIINKDPRMCEVISVTPYVTL